MVGNSVATSTGQHGVAARAERDEKAGYDNSLPFSGVTYGGMGCGPVWYTDVYGFDFATMTAEEE
jgi:hypothetical protein